MRTATDRHSVSDTVYRSSAPRAATGRGADRANAKIAEALGDLGDTKATPELIKLTDAKNDMIKLKAVESLGKLKDLKATATLEGDDIAITCDKKRLTEVRVCMTREFAFRACPEVTQRACRLDKVLMPAVRGGAKARTPS